MEHNQYPSYLKNSLPHHYALVSSVSDGWASRMQHWSDSPAQLIQSIANHLYPFKGWLTPVLIPIAVSDKPKLHAWSVALDLHNNLIHIDFNLKYMQKNQSIKERKWEFSWFGPLQSSVVLVN